MAELRKTGEANRRRVKALEQEVASQRVIAKVCCETRSTACHMVFDSVEAGGD